MAIPYNRVAANIWLLNHRKCWWNCTAFGVLKHHVTRYSTDSARDLPENLHTRLCQGDRAALAKAITLIENTNPKKKVEAEELLTKTMDHIKASWKMGRASFRIGLSGAPGAGKSTLIESLGLFLIGQGHKVAVLAVDPSSTTTGGSILGDKTRMVYLAREPHAFIRPSPNCGTLGGVTRSTNAAVSLCEGAGYDVIFVETVGVGQSEIEVADMVDMFCVIVPPASGDELQALKRGIIEVADAILINKADGDLVPAARRVALSYRSSLKLLQQKYDFWKPKVKLVSAITKDGLPEVWDHMQEFKESMMANDVFFSNRQQQQKAWIWKQTQFDLMTLLKSNPSVMAVSKEVEMEVISGCMSPGQAADVLIRKFITSFPP